MRPTVRSSRVNMRVYSAYPPAAASRRTKLCVSPGASPSKRRGSGVEKRTPSAENAAHSFFFRRIHPHEHLVAPRGVFFFRVEQHARAVRNVP